MPGSPAHAGIDRHLADRVSEAAWFPRTRGDRPCIRCRAQDMTAVPPHTRG